MRVDRTVPPGAETLAGLAGRAQLAAAGRPTGTSLARRTLRGGGCPAGHDAED